MKHITITGKTIQGNRIGAPRQSGKDVDVPTDERGIVTIDGIDYERTVYERIRYGSGKVRARFVIVNGINYEVSGIWHSVVDLGEMQDANSNSLVYGEFGRDTYGLLTTVDGAECVLCVRAERRSDVMREADDILGRLSDGWRPVNW